MKTILQTLLLFCIISTHLNSQAKDTPDFYGDWTLVSSSIDGVKFEIKGSFTETYDYDSMESINNGSLSHNETVITSNCIVKYQIERKNKKRFIQTILSHTGSDCAAYTDGDSMIVDYSVSGDIMTQTIFMNNSKIVSKYKRNYR